MAALIVILCVASVAFSSIAWIIVSNQQKRLQSSLEKQQRNNFYLSVKKNAQTQAKDEPKIEVVSNNDNPICFKETSSVISSCLEEDKREKIPVQLYYDKKVGNNAYQRICGTVILRKDMDVQEIINKIGEPVDIQYDEEFTFMYYIGKDDKRFRLVLYNGNLWKVEK